MARVNTISAGENWVLSLVPDGWPVLAAALGSVGRNMLDTF